MSLFDTKDPFYRRSFFRSYGPSIEAGYAGPGYGGNSSQYASLIGQVAKAAQNSASSNSSSSSSSSSGSASSNNSNSNQGVQLTAAQQRQMNSLPYEWLKSMGYQRLLYNNQATPSRNQLIQQSLNNAGGAFTQQAGPTVAQQMEQLKNSPGSFGYAVLHKNPNIRKIQGVWSVRPGALTSSNQTYQGVQQNQQQPGVQWYRSGGWFGGRGGGEGA